MLKICKKCGKELTSDKFNKQKTGKNGLRSYCRECQSKDSVRYRMENSDKLKEVAKIYHEENRESILKYKKQHYIDNKEYCVKYTRQHYRDNKESIAERMRRYHEENKKYFAEYHKQYKKEHAEQSRINCQRREAIQRKLISTLTVEQWESTKLHFNNSCAYCGKELVLVQEHFIALSKGGEYSKDNIIPSCQCCNSSKNNKDFFTWYPKYKYYSKERENKILEFLNYKNKQQQLTLTLK